LAQDLAHLNGATIVFDLDGTLVETAPDLVATLNFLLDQEGIARLPYESARNLIGKGAKALIAQGFAAAGAPIEEPRLTTLFDRFIVYYRAHIADASRPYPGVTEALDELAGAGAILSVCTNKRTELSVTLLETLGLAGHFASIIGADSAPASKPDPRHLLMAVESAGGMPSRTVMVGDSASDAGAAKSAGIPLVLVSFGYTDVPAEDLGADILIDHFDQLPDACAQLLPVPA
jgi:phosphoglycolate phosphatase